MKYQYATLGGRPSIGQLFNQCKPVCVWRFFTGCLKLSYAMRMHNIEIDNSVLIYVNNKHSNNKIIWLKL